MRFQYSYDLKFHKHFILETIFDNASSINSSCERNGAIQFASIFFN